MNVIVEGISGVGKTTLIDNISKKYPKDDIIVIGDLEYETPIKNVLIEMIQESPLMQSADSFKTSIYESLLLAANHHYIQEKLRNADKLCIYDRDFLSLLVYQKFLIKEEYENWEEIYEAYKKIVLLNLKKVDLLVYISTPLEVAIANTENRDNRKFSANEIDLLKQFRKEYINILRSLKNIIHILELNGMNLVEHNAEIVQNEIKKIRK